MGSEGLSPLVGVKQSHEKKKNTSKQSKAAS